jgi:hypothetical protein
MITLYTFGPMFGLIDANPFVSKAHMLLKLAKLLYQTDTTGFNKAPKKKFVGRQTLWRRRERIRVCRIHTVPRF